MPRYGLQSRMAKRRYRRRFRRGVSGKGGIRSIALKQKVSTIPNMFKLKETGTLTSDGGGIMKMSVTDDPSTATDWSSLSALYDLYRVTSIKIQFVPYFPNDSSVTTGFFPFYVIYDPDNTTSPLTAITDAIQYDTMRVKNMYKPWKVWFKIPKTTSVPGASAVKVVAGGFIDSAAVTATSGIYAYGTGFDVSTSYGTIIITRYLKMRSRR